MIDAKKQEVNQKPELTAEKQVERKVAGHKQSVALFAATLAQGIIPQSKDEGLYEALSLMGNYSFLQALARKENKEKRLNRYAENEKYSRTESGALLARLAADAQHKVNPIEIMPMNQDNQSVPNLLTLQVYLSRLAPVSFDQEVFAREDGTGSLGLPHLSWSSETGGDRS